MEQNNRIFLAVGDPILHRLLAESLVQSCLPFKILGNLDEAVESPEDNNSASCILLDRAQISEIHSLRSLRTLCLLVAANPDSIEGIKNFPQKNIFVSPFRVGLIIDRINSHLNSHSSDEQTGRITIGPLILLPEQNLLIGKNETIRITEKECDILVRLAKAGDLAVDRQTLLAELWGYVAETETHTLETHIYRLRQKIEKDPANPRFLITVETGYKLVVK